MVRGADTAPMTTSSTLHLRRATALDEQALRELAALDSARPLTGDVLLAEVGFAVVAALSLSDGRVVADPLKPTADVVCVLRARAGSARPAGGRTGALGRLSRLAPALLRPA